MHTAQVTQSQVSIRASKPLVPSGVLGMAMFIATETMFFTALISGFLVLRAQSPSWPPLDQPRLPLVITALNTLILLASGWTALRALAPFGVGRETRHVWGCHAAAKWFGITLLLGLTFLGVQGFEWLRLIGFGLTTTSSLYGATFYVLVGAHAAHVLGAVVALFWVRQKLVGENSEFSDVESIQPMVMYWLFVVAVWPTLYGLVYFE